MNKSVLIIALFLSLLTPLAHAGFGEWYNNVKEGPGGLFTSAGIERGCDSYPYFGAAESNGIELWSKYFSLWNQKMYLCPNANSALINYYCYDSAQGSVQFIGEYETGTVINYGVCPKGVYWECYRCPDVADECQVPQQECITEYKFRRCNGNGEWDFGTCTGSQVCEAGACVDVACVDRWTCSGWSTCGPAGSQVRSCQKTSDCDSVAHKPITYQKCNYTNETVPCTFAYGDALCSPCEPRVSLDCTSGDICSDGETMCVDGRTLECFSNVWHDSPETKDCDKTDDRTGTIMAVLIILLLSGILTVVLAATGNKWWWIPGIVLGGSFLWVLLFVIL